LEKGVGNVQKKPLKRETPLQSTLDALQQPLRSVYPDGGGPAVVTYKRIA
jgi:hypothetical protein